MVTTLIAILITWYIGQTSKDIMTGEMIPTIRTLSPVVVLLTMVSMCMLMKTFIRCCIYRIDFRHCMNFSTIYRDLLPPIPEKKIKRFFVTHLSWIFSE
jgi:hypothetical protein